MLTLFVLLFVVFLAAAFALNAPPAVWHAGLWVFGGFAALNLLYVLFWVCVASTVDDSKPLTEKPRRICSFGCWSIANWLCAWFWVRMRVTGEELLPREGRYVMVCNHRSGFDPVSAEAMLGKRGLAFISKPSNLKLPYIGKLAFGAGFLPIDRENDRKALKTILTAADYIKRDYCSMGIYPEGTRNRHPEQGLLPFHAGSFKAAQRANVPLVICCIRGTEKIMHRLLRRNDVYLDVLEVIPAAEVRAASTGELAERARGLIEGCLAAAGEGESHGE